MCTKRVSRHIFLFKTQYAYRYHTMRLVYLLPRPLPSPEACTERKTWNTITALFFSLFYFIWSLLVRVVSVLLAACCSAPRPQG